MNINTLPFKRQDLRGASGIVNDHVVQYKAQNAAPEVMSQHKVMSSHGTFKKNQFPLQEQTQI